MLTLEVATSYVPMEEKKEVLINKIPGQPLGIKLASTDILAGNSSKRKSMAVVIESIATGSPAHATGSLK